MRSRSSCGLWLVPAARGRRPHLLAVEIAADGRTGPPIRAALTDDARWGLLRYLMRTGDSQLVLPEALAKSDPIATLAARAGLSLWLVPQPLVEALRAAAALPARAPHFSAAMLARLPRIPLLRAELRRSTVAHDSRQQDLW